MNLHLLDPHDAAFKAELDELSPNISADSAILRPCLRRHIVEAILRRGCQAQHSRNIILGREAAREIPRDWLAARVEGIAGRVLNREDEWEYRRLLELYSEFDAGLLQRLVARGLASADADIREAAEDFRN